MDEMQQWVADLDEEVILAGQSEIDQANVDVRVDYLLEVTASIMQEQARNKAVYDARKAKLDRWWEEQTLIAENRMSYVRDRILTITAGYDYGKKKSRALPNGTFGWRKVPARVEVVNPQAALDWAKKNQIQIKVAESVLLKPLLSAVQKQLQSTGELPDPDVTGVRFEDATERFYIQPNTEAK
jgi:phage host-nuclease inhibitor protein Gam